MNLDINQTISLLTDIITQEFNKIDPVDTSIFHPLINGYCLHFAILLHHFFPEGQIFFSSKDQHYIFYLNGRYYDYRGELIQTKDFLIINSTDDMTLIKDLLPVKYDKTEIEYAEITGYDSKEPTQKWLNIQKRIYQKIKELPLESQLEL